jgi:catechol 2,3-dioxygenase-like lactoylglutathione lyase family enzyme
MTQQAAGRGVVQAQFLSHGTIACHDLAKSRQFYEEFLGLEVSQVAPLALALRLTTNVYIACVCLGDKAPENSVWSHIGLNVARKEDVDRAHEEALRCQEIYAIQRIETPRMLHGAYQFYLQDRDTNWWEIQYETRSIDDFFALPDLASND